MIKQLRLKNYILIDELSANFDGGFNVITGETGAGKSILINAIDLVFAPRVSKEVIKTGCDKAVIELVLDNTKHDLSRFFEENGIDDLGNEIIISKEITQNSVRSRINGTLANTDLLRSLRALFVDIHSQHQTYAFMQPRYHICLLDSYGRGVYGGKLKAYGEKYARYADLLKRLEEAKSSADRTESQIEFLRFQIDEIEKAEIKSEREDEELSAELEVLENAEKLKELTGSAYWALNGDDGSVAEGLNRIRANVSKAAGYDSKLAGIEQCLIEASEALREVGSDLNRYSQSLENDTERLNEIQERLFLLDKLKRKYGGSLEGVLAEYEKLSEELRGIEYCEKSVEELEGEIGEVLGELRALAGEISAHRRDFAGVLSDRVQEKLALLELPKSRFEIRVENKELGADGGDEVEFLISTNVSEDLKPLSKVASGGEISRVMLAIKSIFAENDEIDTVIFDEIDTGISGRASQSVAEEIKALSKFHQVILITHQPVIAAKADKHFYVRKCQTDATRVEVYVLVGENRIKALAELAGGEINQQSVEFARSLVQN